MSFREIVNSPYPLVVGFVVAGGAWIYAALGGNRPLAINIFLAAWVLAVGAMVARALIQKSEDSIMAGPIKVGVIGFSVAALAGIAEFLTGSEQSVGFKIGWAIMLIGIGWGVVRLARHQ